MACELSRGMGVCVWILATDMQGGPVRIRQGIDASRVVQR